MQYIYQKKPSISDKNNEESEKKGKGARKKVNL